MVQLLSDSTILCTLTRTRSSRAVTFDTNAAGCSFLSNPITAISAPVSTVNTPQGQYPDPTAVEIQINLNYASGNYTVQSCYPLTNCGSFTNMGTVTLTGAVTVAPLLNAASITVDNVTYQSAASFAAGSHILSSSSSSVAANTVMAYSFFDGTNLYRTGAPSVPNASASSSCPWGCSGGTCSTPLPPTPSPAPLIYSVTDLQGNQNPTIYPGVPTTFIITGEYFGGTQGNLGFCPDGANPCVIPGNLCNLPPGAICSTLSFLQWSDGLIEATVTLSSAASGAWDVYVISNNWITGTAAAQPSRGIVTPSLSQISLRSNVPGPPIANDGDAIIATIPFVLQVEAYNPATNQRITNVSG